MISFFDLLQQEGNQDEESTFLGLLKKFKAPFPTDEKTWEDYGLRIVDARTPEEKKKMATDWLQMESREKALTGARSLAHFFGGLAESGTLGATKLVPQLQMPEPQGPQEQIFSGAGHFAGFFTTPLAIGKLGAKLGAKIVGKLLGKAPQAIQRGAQYALETPLTLGTAEAVSDITKPLEAHERFLSGVTTGGIFAISGLSHLTKYKPLNQILSQFGGRALMALAGHYPEGSFTEENLANLVFNEAINTFFLSHGMHPRTLLTGKLSPVEKREADKVRKAISEANQERLAHGEPLLPSLEEIVANRDYVERLKDLRHEDQVRAQETLKAMYRQEMFNEIKGSEPDERPERPMSMEDLAEKNLFQLDILTEQAHKSLYDTDAFMQFGFYDYKNPIPKYGGILEAKKTDLYRQDPAYRHWVDQSIKNVTDAIVEYNRVRSILRGNPSTGAFGVDYQIKQKRRATYTVNVGRAWYMEAKNKYPNTDYLGDVSVREALQNSLDAVLEAVENGQIKRGKIGIQVGEGTWDSSLIADRFRVYDNGIGMSEDDIADNFLALHGTGKDKIGRFGGFGIAKAVILSPHESAKWELRTRDNYFNGDLAQANERIQALSEPMQGTDITVTADQVITTTKSKAYVETTEFPKNVDVIFNTRDITFPFKGKKSKREHVEMDEFSSADLTYYPKVDDPDYNQKLIIRLVDKKTGAKLTQGITRIWNEGFAGTLFCDVTTTATPGSNGYPLTSSRMEFKWDGRKHIDKIIEKYSTDKKSAQRVGTESKFHKLIDRPEWKQTIKEIQDGNDAEYNKLWKVIDDIFWETSKFFSYYERPNTPIETLPIKIDVGVKGNKGGSSLHARHLQAYEAIMKLSSTQIRAPWRLNKFYGLVSKEIMGGKVEGELNVILGNSGVNYLCLDKTSLKSAEHYAIYVKNLVDHELTHTRISAHNEDFTSALATTGLETAGVFKYIVRIAEAVTGKETEIGRRVEIARQKGESIQDVFKEYVGEEQLELWREQAEGIYDTTKTELYYPEIPGQGLLFELGTRRPGEVDRPSAGWPGERGTTATWGSPEQPTTQDVTGAGPEGMEPRGERTEKGGTYRIIRKTSGELKSVRVDGEDYRIKPEKPARSVKEGTASGIKPEDGADRAPVFYRSSGIQGELGMNTRGNGIFFGNDIGLVKNFSKTGEPSTIYAVRLDIKNPYYLNWQEIEALGGRGLSKLIPELRSQGYDAIVEKNDTLPPGEQQSPWQVAVFDRSQVHEIGSVPNPEGRFASPEKLQRDIDDLLRSTEEPVQRKMKFDPEGIHRKPTAQEKLAEIEQQRERLHAVKLVDTFTFNPSSERLKPKVGADSLDVPDPGEIKFRRNPDTGKIEVLDFGKNIRNSKISQIVDQARLVLSEWDAKPYGTIDDGTKIKLEQELRGMDFEVDEMNVFMRLAGIDPEEATVVNWYKVESLLNAVKKADAKDRMDVALQYAGLWERYKIENPEIAKLTDAQDAFWKGVHLKQVKKARNALRGGGGKPPKKRGSILTELLKLRSINLDHLVDLRVVMQRLELRSRIPFYSKSYKALSKGEAFARRELRKLIEPLNDVIKQIGKPTEVDQRTIENYYWHEYQNWEIDTKIAKLEERARQAFEKGRSVDQYRDAIEALEAKRLPRIEVDPKQRSIINAIDTLMETLAPEIKIYRFKQWYENVYRNGEKLNIFKNQEKLETLLKDGAQVFEQGGEEALRAWLADKDIGVIQAGHFLPGVVLGGRAKEMSLYRVEDYSKLIDFLGTAHTRIRGEAYGENFDTTLFNLYNNPLMMRIHSYVKQVMNLKHMDAPLKDFAKLLEPFKDIIAKAQPEKPLGGIENKAESTEQLLKLMAHRKKQYPVVVPWLGRQIKRVQSVFFRSLVVRPHLWFRNLFQQYVTPTHKLMVMDPRFLKVRYKNLPKHVQEFFDTHVSQFDSFKYDYLFLEETKRLTERGILKHFLKIAEDVGMVYPLTDQLNRKVVFTRTFRRSEHYLNLFREGKISAKKLENRLGLNKMRPLERRDIWELVDQKKYEEASMERAKWESDNSQWKYQRSEKSFWEMTAEGEAWTNLLTWSKGINQSLGNSLGRVYEGYKTKNLGMMRRGIEPIITIALAGMIANELYQNITGAIGAKHRDYGMTDMIFWEIGGVSFDILTQSMQTVGDFINATYQGFPDEKKKASEKLLQLFDNVVLRQLTPFMKNALSIFESMTGRSYVEPTKEIAQLIGMIGKKPITFVDRTMWERFTHAIFSKDPNKSQATRRFVGTQAQVYQDKANQTRNPAMKAYYSGQAMRYERMFRILLRYEPIEPMMRTLDREYEREIEKYSDRSFYELLTKEEEKASREMREINY